MNRKRITVSINAPAVLGFVAICVAAQILDQLLGGMPNRYIFSVYRSSLLNPLTYVRCVCHVFGHDGWGHLFNNMMYLLLVGPMLEEKYGSRDMIFVFVATALVTGIISMIFFPNIMLLGASGVVFALILLSSITSVDDHTIPLTFILVAVLYIGQQVVEGLLTTDNISQLTHIIGGTVGSVIGFALRKPAKNRYY